MINKNNQIKDLKQKMANKKWYDNIPLDERKIIAHQKYINRIQYHKEYNTTPKGKDRIKHHLIKRKYNITKEELISILLNQSNKCAICGYNLDSYSSKLAHIDHNHLTNKVRGILCSNCNIALGHFKDNITTLYNAINYLEKNK